MHSKQQLSNLNPEQKIDQILIETPLRSETVLNENFETVQKTLLEDVQKLYHSDYFEAINIHYGAKSKFDKQNIQQQLYERRKEILKLKISEEHQCIKKVMSARSQEEVQIIQKQYNKNLRLINERKDKFIEGEFVPWIYVDAKKKRPLYGKIFQEFDRKGAAMLKAMIGYRSPFANFDKIEFNMQTLPIQYLRKRKYYVFGLNWMNPVKVNNQNYDLFINNSHSCSPIFKSIDQRKLSTSFGLGNEKQRIQLQFSKRYLRFFDNIHQNCYKNNFLPSRKLSVKRDITYLDSIERGDIMTGKYINSKIEATVPLLSQSNFLKYDLSYRKFFDIYGWSHRFQNTKIKEFLKYSNIQSNFSLKAVVNISKYISDMHECFEIRGFENQRSPDDSVCQVKSSVKVNNYNYPLFGKIGIVPFLYGQAGVSLKKKVKQSHALGSLGLGVSYPLSKFVHLQVLYALCQFQNRPLRQPINFQIRIGFMD